MSLAWAPVKISRAKAAPVAAAGAMVAIGSQSTLPPKGTVISARSRPMTMAMVAVEAGSTFSS
jgi:hypothetical protein